MALAIRAHLSTVPSSGCHTDNLESAQRQSQDGEGPGYPRVNDSGRRWEQTAQRPGVLSPTGWEALGKQVNLAEPLSSHLKWGLQSFLPGRVLVKTN